MLVRSLVTVFQEDGGVDEGAGDPQAADVLLLFVLPIKVVSLGDLATRPLGDAVKGANRKNHKMSKEKKKNKETNQDEEENCT